MDSIIAFGYKPSIGLLKIDTMEFKWLLEIEKNHEIFERISKVADFDYYYMNEILIIPDPLFSFRLNWYRKIFIDDLEIECKGNFLAFFHYKFNNNKDIVFADSLLLTEYIYLKNNIKLDENCFIELKL